MGKKHDAFALALKRLCREHRVALSVGEYVVGVWDEADGRDPLEECQLVDMTRERRDDPN